MLDYITISVAKTQNNELCYASNENVGHCWLVTGCFYQDNKDDQLV